MIEISTDNSRSESTDSSESSASNEAKVQEEPTDGFFRKDPDSPWYTSSDSKLQKKNEAVQDIDVHNYTSPFVYKAKTSMDNSIMIKYSRFRRKQQKKDPFYFKWGLWMNIGSSKCMHEILETQGQLEAKMNEPKWRSPGDITILRLGLVPGQRVNKVALKVPSAEQRDFYLSLCNISMDSVLYRSEGIHVPIIGMSLRPKENYAVVKLWLGSCESGQTEPQQILNLLQNVAALIPEEYVEIIASGIYIREDGESYRVFEFDKPDEC